jgi:protein TonB
MHVEGTIILHIIVGKDGAVKDAEAISGPAALRGAAVASVRQWIFRPFEILGKPTEVETNVRVTFTLS